MSSKKYLFGMLCTVGLASLASAQVIVDSTGATPGSVTTINAALATQPAEIVVKNTGVYEEALLITFDTILRGEDPNNPPIIAMKGNSSQPAAGTGDGIYLGGDGLSGGDMNFTLKNFILIPHTDGSLTDDAISICPKSGFMLNVTLDNLLIAPNNGSNAPLATSVWDDPDLAASGVVRVPDDGVYIMTDTGLGGLGGLANGNITNVTIIGVGGGTANGDGLICFPGDDTTFNVSGFHVSYSSSDATQISHKTDWNYTGTRTNPSVIFRKNGHMGLQHLRGKTLNVDHAVSIDNGTRGVRVDSDNTDVLNLTNSLIANNGTEGFWADWPSAIGPKTFTISNSTIFGNGASQAGAANVKIEANSNADLTLNIVDSIIAGAGTRGLHNLSGAALNVSNCGLPTTGVDALEAVIHPDSTGPVNITNSLSDDPQFANTSTIPFAPNAFDILAGAYATASSTNGALNGWGDGPPPADVADWAMY